MSDLATFNDAESVVMDLLEQRIPGLAPGPDDVIHVTNVGVPNSVADYPYVRVTRISGGDDRISDYPRLDVEVFSPSRAQAWAIAEAIRAELLSFPHRVGGALIDRVRTESAPVRAIWTDPTIHRLVATYTLSARR